jgi:Na+/proline symporter
VLAAVMSTVSAATTAFAGLWTMDVCQELFRSNASEVELVGRGRRSSFMALLLGAALAPLLVLWDKGVVAYVLEVTAVVGPPVAVIALVAFFWSRAHGRAALMALVVGILAGAGLWFVATFGEMVPEWMHPVLNRAGLSGAVSFVLLVLATFVIPQDPEELYDPDTRWSFKNARLPAYESESGTGPRSLLFWWLVLALVTAAVWVVFK